MKQFFITGTDTGVGKTTVACQLLRYWGQQGMKTIGLKPIAAGCQLTHDGYRNDDALALQAAANVALPYSVINPIALPDAIAPHIAARNLPLNVTSTLTALKPGLSAKADVICIEGAGGWLVPLNQHETFADLAVAINAPIILVVGIRLGCINHARLTAWAIQQSQLPFAGWIANILIPDMPALTENIHTLQEQLPAPLLSTLDYNGTLELT